MINPPINPAIIRPLDVADFWATLQHRYGTTRLNRNDSTDMQFLAGALDTLGIMDKKTFMENCVTTIGRRMWTPFEPGVPVGPWDLWTQIRVAVHEHNHVVLDDQEPALNYETRYIGEPPYRARVEALCYRCEAALEYRYLRHEMDPEEIARVLREGYALPEADAAFVVQVLRTGMESIRRGALPSPVLQFSVAWLDARLDGR